MLFCCDFAIMVIFFRGVFHKASDCTGEIQRRSGIFPSSCSRLFSRVGLKRQRLQSVATSRQQLRVDSSWPKHQNGTVAHPVSATQQIMRLRQIFGKANINSPFAKLFNGYWKLITQLSHVTGQLDDNRQSYDWHRQHNRPIATLLLVILIDHPLPKMQMMRNKVNDCFTLAIVCLNVCWGQQLSGVAATFCCNQEAHQLMSWPHSYNFQLPNVNGCGVKHCHLYMQLKKLHNIICCRA